MAKQPTKRGVKVTKKAPAKKAAGTELAAQRGGGDLLDQFTRMRRDVDRMFDDFFRSFPSMLEFDPFRRVGRVADWAGVEIAPRVEVSESDKAYEIAAELPGVDEKDITLSLEDGMLTLAGAKKAERSGKEKGYRFSERSYGAFRRSFRVPADVDEDKIAADFKKGVMTVTLPKSVKAKGKGRAIPIG